MPPAPFQAPPMGSSGPASPPTQNPGMQAEGASMVREAVQLLQKALNAFPIGTDEHGEIMAMIQKGAKLVPPTAGIPGVQQTMLNNLQQQAGRDGMLNMLKQKMMAQGGGEGGAPPGGAPPPSPMS